MISWPTALGLAAGFCTTISFLPQVVKTWATRSTGDISLGMFSVLVFGTVLWILYGVTIGDLPLIASNGVTLVFTTAILFFKIRQG